MKFYNPRKRQDFWRNYFVQLHHDHEPAHVTVVLREFSAKKQHRIDAPTSISSGHSPVQLSSVSKTVEELQREQATLKALKVIQNTKLDVLRGLDDAMV